MRREALARKLAGGRQSRLPPGPNTPPVPSGAAESAAAELRRRYAERQAQVQRTQVKALLDEGEQALRRSDPVAAAAAYRNALALAPDDPKVKERLREVQSRADAVLATNYMKQGAYEEKSERWKDAARSYIRAAELLRTDADAQDRAGLRHAPCRPRPAQRQPVRAESRGAQAS